LSIINSCRASDEVRDAILSRRGGLGFSDFTKVFADMKLPAMPDMEAFVTASRRNMETLTAANRVALEGAQAVARRHMEIMQQNMTEMTEAMRSMSTMEAPQAKAAKQAELLKQAYERAVANMKELGDLIQQSNAEAVKLLNNRFTEAMDEIKLLAAKPKA
jgi:phasin family protein